MGLTEEEIKRIYRIQKTLMQMLKDRGYFIADSEITMTLSQFVRKHGDNMKREDLVTLRAKRNDSCDQLYVFFPDEVKVGVNTMKLYTNRMKSENVYRAILVVQQNLTPFARNCISQISSKFHLEVFQEAEMLVNIKEHLPRIQVTDPIARYFGLKRGQVVKIIRPSETAGRYVTYRYAV
ncbi:hypothetical protein F2Q70_00022622 [Brassica cretica]|uniref:RNA polymerase subunit H/Rpb5 C-terminal domain-containing protein n=1 Tax=Brassica cretica TaxID=69181 RepID=A0A8S9GSE3_BRACR|nr:hypothetical protein F2Q70_00022622 [Brassica cretica]